MIELAPISLADDLSVIGQDVSVTLGDLRDLVKDSVKEASQLISGTSVHPDAGTAVHDAVMVSNEPA